MKSRLILIFFSFCISTFAYADTCPPIEELDPQHPPAGWQLLVPPIIPDQKYEFTSAIHSLNGAFYYKQVICKYAACPSNLCPAFTLISEKTYELPNTKTPPWDSHSVFAFTYTCSPPDHNPAQCRFE